MSRRWLVGILCCLTVLGAGAQIIADYEVNPDQPIEFVEFQGAAGVEPVVAVQTSFDSVARDFTYSYGVESRPSSRQPLVMFAIGTTVAVTDVTVPVRPEPTWWGGSQSEATDWWPAVVSWGPREEEGLLAPGQRIDGLSFRSAGLVGLGTSYIQGDVVPPQGQQVVLPPPPGYSYKLVDDSVKRPMLVPMAPPLQAAEIANFLRTQAAEATGLGWIQTGSVEPTLTQIGAELSAGRIEAAKMQIQNLLASLEAGRGSLVTDEGYYLLKPDLEYLLTKMVPNSALEMQAEVISKHVKPHKNERAEVRVTSSTSPMAYHSQVKRQGAVVYQTQVSGQTGPYLLVWNGYTNGGQQVSNGDHDIVIIGTDSFGRTATKTVKVVVNFQGK